MLPPAKPLGTGYPRLGLVHREATPVVILIMESLDRRLGFGVRVHLDEAEPLAAARVTVRDNKADDPRDA